MKKLLILFTLLTASAFAQTNASPYQPQYYIGSGASYDYYGKTGVAAQTEFGVRIGNSNVYSYTTMELNKTASTLRTGAAYLITQQGNWSIYALGDAGFAQAGATLGSFSGGGIVMYDIGAKVTKGLQHFYIGGGGRLVTISGLGNQPVGVLTFGKGF